MPETSNPERSARQLVYFAAERKLLSWVRTSLAVIVLGFVFDRFGLLLRRTGTEESVPTRNVSSWLGVVLVVLGAVMACCAAVRYWRFAVRYHRGMPTEPGRGIAMMVGFAILLAALVLLIAGYLTFLPD